MPLRLQAMHTIILQTGNGLLLLHFWQELHMVTKGKGLTSTAGLRQCVPSHKVWRW